MNEPDKRLAGRVVFVTGAARGMGCAVVGLVLLVAACGSTVRPSAGGTDVGTVGPEASGLAAHGQAPPGVTGTGTSPATTRPADGMAAPSPAGTGSAAPQPATARPSSVTPPPEPSGVGDTDTTASPADPPRPSSPQEGTAPQEVSGRGFDEGVVKIGVGTADNASSTATAIGLNNISFGDTRAQAQAVLDDVNANGGILGRQAVAVYHDDNAADFNYDGKAQKACTTWTEDDPVAAVANHLAAVMNETLFACLAQHDTPIFSQMNASLDDVLLQEFSPYVWLSGYVNWTRLVPLWLERLEAQGYFEPDAVFGLITRDDPVLDRASDLVRRGMDARGTPLAAEFAFSSQTEQALGQMNSAVLAMRARGVTHVMSVSGAIAFVAPQAESQGYRPRWAGTTFDGLGSFSQTTAGPEQWTGFAGVGWLPPADVDAAHDPGDVTPAEAHCKEIMQAAGQDTSVRLTEWVMLILCDAIWMFDTAAERGGGFDTASVHAGMASLADGSFQSSLTWVSRWAERVHDGAGAIRDIGYDPVDGAFVYTSDNLPAP